MLFLFIQSHPGHGFQHTKLKAGKTNIQFIAGSITKRGLEPMSALPTLTFALW
jgi:hypothetical protein